MTDCLLPSDGDAHAPAQRDLHLPDPGAVAQERLGQATHSCAGMEDELRLVEALRKQPHRASVVARKWPVRPGYGERAMRGETADAGPTVAIVVAGNVLEDWLVPLGVSFDEFLEEMSGSWVFNYVSAMSRTGIRPIIVCHTENVTTPERFVHRPTGETV
jgi:hypothetical protein